MRSATDYVTMELHDLKTSSCHYSFEAGTTIARDLYHLTCSPIQEDHGICNPEGEGRPPHHPLSETHSKRLTLKMAH